VTAAPPYGEIAFARHCGTGCADIYVVRTDGKGLRRITRTRNNFDPAWSPDGQQIVFASDRAGGSGAPELYVMDADGSRVRRLTRTVHDRDNWRANYEPAWSPDASRIAFVRLVLEGGESRADLWVVDADGRGARRLTRNAVAESDPTWSRDDRIAFSRGGDLYVIGADGKGERLLVRGGTMPAWSPDGARIAFVGKDGGVEIVQADGGARTRLRGTRGSSPAWASDASWLVYERAGSLYVVDSNGAGRTRITRALSLRNDLDASWRPLAPMGPALVVIDHAELRPLVDAVCVSATVGMSYNRRREPIEGGA